MRGSAFPYSDLEKHKTTQRKTAPITAIGNGGWQDCGCLSRYHDFVSIPYGMVESTTMETSLRTLMCVSIPYIGNGGVCREGTKTDKLVCEFQSLI